MQIFNTIADLQAFLSTLSAARLSTGLVPTMGALHAGHRALLERARAENDRVVATVFVNPVQFNNPVDLQHYPRPWTADLALLEKAGCDVVFAPSEDEMYPHVPDVSVRVPRLSQILEGAFRPGHFEGVALVVTKLFNITQPTRAYFGQKDFQQVKVIEALVKDLNIPLQLVTVPTVREPDGLALSSRNVRLTDVQRKQAVLFYQILVQAREGIRKQVAWADIYQQAHHTLGGVSDMRLEYLALATRENLILTEDVTLPQPLVILLAGYAGEVRLIDNLWV